MKLQAGARAGGVALAGAVMRSSPADFCVDEELGFEPDGQGEHLLLQIEKTGLTTPQAAAVLAQCAGLARRQVSWSGLKDRNAVTTQWLSLHMPGAGLPESVAPGTQPAEGLRVLRAGFHGRKLRPGTHRGNRFRIHLRDLHTAPAELEAGLSRLAAHGAPNYFGAQRFGHHGANLDLTVRRRGRQARGMHLSALRAQLFNAVLDARVRAGNWCQVLPGDALQFADGHSFFVAETPDATLQARVDRGELHVTGPLHGQGDPLSQGPVRDLEAQVIAEFPAARDILEKAGMKPARRALRLFAEGLSWQLPADGEVTLEFRLRAGGFATSLLQELFDLRDAGSQEAA